MKLLDFDLEIALKHPERVVFGNGEKPVDWKYFDKGVSPIVVLNVEGFYSLFKKTGEKNCINYFPENLKLLPETKTYWYCLYNYEGTKQISSFYGDKKEFLKTNSFLGNIEILQEHTYTETI